VTKKVVSKYEFKEFPAKFNDYVPINGAEVKKFFSIAKESLQGFIPIIRDTIDEVSKF